MTLSFKTCILCVFFFGCDVRRSFRRPQPPNLRFKNPLPMFYPFSKWRIVEAKITIVRMIVKDNDSKDRRRGNVKKNAVHSINILFYILLFNESIFVSIHFPIFIGLKTPNHEKVGWNY